jgi:DNA mismatch repair protein MutS
MVDELPLFAAAAPSQPEKRESDVEARLKALTIDELSPRDALQMLYDLKSLTKE